MKNWHELEICEKGKFVNGQASALGKLLLTYGAEPGRLLDPDFDYGGQMVRIPAEAIDCIVALLLHLTPRPQGRPPKESTLYARILTGAGMSQRRAAHKVAENTGEKPESIRGRLVVRSKTRSRKTRSPKPGSTEPR